MLLHAPVGAAPVESGVAADRTDKADKDTVAALESVDKPRPKINHVLIISEDGLRADAVATLHLKWHDLMRKRGSYSDHALTIRDASTLPAHASMLSGVEPKVHGLTWNTWRPREGYIKTPTIFTHAMDAGLTTAFFTGKSKLRHIVPPGSVGMYERPGYYCKKVAEEAAHVSDDGEAGAGLRALLRSRRARPLQGLDVVGAEERHQPTATAASASSTRRSRSRGSSTTRCSSSSADHGGHNRVHSGAKKIDREIPWIACGPGVREDFVITEPLSTMDTAATALYALGLPIPTISWASRAPTSSPSRRSPASSPASSAAPRSAAAEAAAPARPSEPSGRRSRCC